VIRCAYLKDETEPACNAMRDNLRLIDGEPDALCLTDLHPDCPRYCYAREQEPASRSFPPREAIGFSVRA